MYMLPIGSVFSPYCVLTITQSSSAIYYILYPIPNIDYTLSLAY